MILQSLSYAKRRWVLLLIGLGALLVLGFYTATSPQRLHNSLILDGSDWVGYAFCHRFVSHSFTINGRPLALCARCTGMYLGVALTALLLGLAGRIRQTDLPTMPITAVLALFIAIMGLDGLNSVAHSLPVLPHVYEPQNWLRLVTGMGTGLAMGAFMLPALGQTLWQADRYQPALRSWQELLELVMVAGAAVLLILSNQAPILYLLSIVSALGLLLILTAINCILLLVLLRRDGQAKSWSAALWPLILGLSLAILQIGTISYFRYSLTGTMSGLPGLP
ncbi:MAG: DUF2085 domain-containing protein [Chloroflexota bacterium]